MFTHGTGKVIYSNAKLSDITVDNVIYALDSTTISTSIKLAAWALGKYSKGAQSAYVARPGRRHTC